MFARPVVVISNLFVRNFQQDEKCIITQVFLVNKGLEQGFSRGPRGDAFFSLHLTFGTKTKNSNTVSK